MGEQTSEAAIHAAHASKKKVNTSKVLSRRKVIITLTDVELLCECGACREVIRTEVKEIINYIPAVFEFIEQHREVAACLKCKEGVVTAPASLQLLASRGIYQQRYATPSRKVKSNYMKEFYAWLDKIQPTVLPQSTLGKAVAYTLNHRLELIRFLDDGRLEIDNNHTEWMIKPLVIARKNFMFSNSVNGTNAVCMDFSLIQTAKLHGLDPYEYYLALLRNIPYCKTVEDYELLLPWNIKAEHIPVPTITEYSS